MQEVNLPSAFVVAIAFSAGVLELLQPARRASTVAPDIGAFVPISATIPEIDAVPGGCGPRWLTGFCAAIESVIPRRAGTTAATRCCLSIPRLRPRNPGIALKK